MNTSPWVRRWGREIQAGRVLDVACGGGRHALYLAGLGYQVDAVDRQPPAMPEEACRGIRWWRHDLEAAPWPFEPAGYQGVVVTNYLHRPLFPHLLAALAPGGVLIYETFAVGQERFGRPRNPAHLLLSGELLEWARGSLRVLAFEDVLETLPTPRRVQRLCGIRP